MTPKDKQAKWLTDMCIDEALCPSRIKCTPFVMSQWRETIRNYLADAKKASITKPSAREHYLRQAMRIRSAARSGVEWYYHLESHPFSTYMVVPFIPMRSNLQSRGIRGALGTIRESSHVHTS